MSEMDYEAMARWLDERRRKREIGRAAHEAEMREEWPPSADAFYAADRFVRSLRPMFPAPTERSLKLDDCQENDGPRWWLFGWLRDGIDLLWFVWR